MYIRVIFCSMSKWWTSKNTIYQYAHARTDQNTYRRILAQLSLYRYNFYRFLYKL